jgi:hypothetical protein
MDTLHEDDLHVFLSTKVTWWGISSLPWLPWLIWLPWLKVKGQILVNNQNCYSMYAFSKLLKMFCQILICNMPSQHNATEISPCQHICLRLD